jgi:uncharacterized membrane protein/predicted DsbA family dithiol-disulfide isomerase
MKYRLWGLRLILLFALGVCGAILGEYLFAGTFCSFRSGCGNVLTSDYARPLGLPLPAFGLVGFGLLFVLALFPGREAFRLVGPLAVAAGFSGLGLILLQVLKLKETCTLCLLVDGSAIALAVLVLAGRDFFLPFPPRWGRGGEEAPHSPPLSPWERGEESGIFSPEGRGEQGGILSPEARLEKEIACLQPLSPEDEGEESKTRGFSTGSPLLRWLVRSAWLAGAILAVALPLLLARVWANPPVPEQVMAHWVEGKITVVDLVDFNCSHCQKAEPELQAFREKMGDKIHFVRIPAPMRKHEHARPPARAFLAAQKQGKGEEMAKELFAAPPHLDDKECSELAKKIVGLDMDQYKRVVEDPATDAQLDDTNAWAEATGSGLPLIWVGDQMVAGVPNQTVLQIAYRRAVLSADAARRR